MYRAWAKLHASGAEREGILRQLGIDAAAYARAYQWARSHELLVPRRAKPHSKPEEHSPVQPHYRARQIREWPDLPADAFK